MITQNTTHSFRFTIPLGLRIFSVIGMLGFLVMPKPSTPVQAQTTIDKIYPHKA